MAEDQKIYSFRKSKACWARKKGYAPTKLVSKITEKVVDEFVLRQGKTLFVKKKLVKTNLKSKI